MKSRKAKPTTKEVLHLQEIVLRAVLEGKPLPGSSQAIRFPDLAFVQRHDSIYVAAEEIKGKVAAGGAPKPVQILPLAALRTKAKEGGGLAYLQFGPPHIEADSVELTLEGRMATADPKEPSLGLSSIHVKFRKVEGRWEAQGEPIFSAN